MSKFDSKSYRAIYTDMVTWIIANQDIITDFNEGSAITSYCEAVAIEIEQLYLRAKIGFNKYLFDLPVYAFGFTKIAGRVSSGSVYFSRNVVSTSEITIPIGTIVSTPSGLKYTTTSVGTILTSQTTSNAVTITSNEIGKVYNIPINSVTVIQTPVIGVNTVNNILATSGGLDEEADSDFQIRFNAYILGLGKSNNYGLITGALSVIGVRSASVREHFPPLDGYYNVSVYIDDGAGNASEELIESVRLILEGDGSEIYPGYKAGGINLRVLAPTKVPITIDLRIYNNGLITDEASVTAQIESAIEGYINNLKLGESVIKNKIIDVVMDIPVIYDVLLYNPTTNTAVGVEQIARVDSINIVYINL